MTISGLRIGIVAVTLMAFGSAGCGDDDGGGDTNQNNQTQGVCGDRRVRTTELTF